MFNACVFHNRNNDACSLSQTTQILQSIDSQFSEWLHCCASLGDTFHGMTVVALYGYLSVVLIKELIGVTWLDHLQLEHMMASLHPQNKHPRFGKLVAVAGGADAPVSCARAMRPSLRVPRFSVV